MTIPADTFIVQRMGAEAGPFTVADLQAQVAGWTDPSGAMAAAPTYGDGFLAAEIPGLFSERSSSRHSCLVFSARSGSTGSTSATPGSAS